MKALRENKNSNHVHQKSLTTTYPRSFIKRALSIRYSAKENVDILIYKYPNFNAVLN